MANRILVIDDVQSDSFRVASILRKNVSGPPYDVTECCASKDAFKHLAQGDPYQAVICDYILPDCDGVTLLKLIQKTLGDATPPFLFVTSHAPTWRKKRAPPGRAPSSPSRSDPESCSRLLAP